MKIKEKAYFMRKIFKADRISGIEGCVFSISFFIEVLRASNYRHIFKFPFYSLTLDTSGERLDEWIDEEKYGKVCDEIISYARKNGLGYFKKVEKQAEKETGEFLDYAWNMSLSVLEMTDIGLLGKFNDFLSKYFWAFGLGGITFLYEHILSARLNDYLAKNYENVGEILEKVLKTDYESFMTESEEMLVKIKTASNGKKKELIREYIKKYYFIDTSYHHKIELNEKSVLEKARKIKTSEKINRLADSANGNKFSKEEKIIIELLKSTEIIRDKRKQVAMAGVYCMQKFLDEAAQRRKISLENAKLCYWFEFNDLLENTNKALERVKKRKYMSVVLDENNLYYLDYIAIENRNSADANTEFFKGAPAAKGKYKGKVKIIVTKKDFVKMKKGDILVTDMTRPDYLAIMRLAGAILTDEGGLTCHAAVVSREMGIPCIVGTKIATQVLKDGDLVEVDANRGIVRIIKKAK